MRRTFAAALAALALAAAGCEDSDARARAEAAEKKAKALEARVADLEKRLEEAEGALQRARRSASDALGAAAEAKRTAGSAASNAESRARRAAIAAVDARLARNKPVGTVRPGDVTGAWTYTWIHPARKAPKSNVMTIADDGTFSTSGGEKGAWQLSGTLLMLRFGADGLYRNVVVADPASDEWGGISNSGNAITLKRRPPAPPAPPE